MNKWTASASHVLTRLDVGRRRKRPKSPFVGFMVLVASCAVVLFVVVQAWKFAFFSQYTDDNTVPFEEYQLSRTVSFTFVVQGKTVNATDAWREHQAAFLAQPRPNYISLSSYTFPVGWDIVDGQLQRSVSLLFDLDNDGGFAWSLSASASSIECVVSTMERPALAMSIRVGSKKPSTLS